MAARSRRDEEQGAESRAPSSRMSGLAPGRLVHFADPFSGKVRAAHVVDVLDSENGQVSLAVLCPPNENGKLRCAEPLRFVGSAHFDRGTGAIPTGSWRWPERS